jgi:hypothetical protein
MRTTIDVDEDVLLNMKQIAAQRGTTLGQAVSELLREALRPNPSAARTRNGVPLFQPLPNAKLPSLALVNALRDGVDEV